jgi:two-component system, OmpR family, copper resistance phosphate regulon response regulator CusR
MRILVVEDDHKVADFIQSGLEQEGYAVDVLRDGTFAGEQARVVDYDAVVLDLMLPGSISSGDSRSAALTTNSMMWPSRSTTPSRDSSMPSARCVSSVRR